MKHYIIVKYNQKAEDKAALLREITALFETSKEIPGIHEVNLYTSVIDLPNRYDLMIVMEMEREALDEFDHSSVHAVWKRDYADYIESKAIFDSI